MIAKGSDLISVLRDPLQAHQMSNRQWTEVISLARRELVLGHLAQLLTDVGIMPALPIRLQHMLHDGLREAGHSHRHARGEARHIASSLQHLGCRIIILKGSAYVLAGLKASGGRLAGDLDILVPRSYLGAAEIALQSAGFHMIVKDAYDDHYYRAWMHELPPFQHIERKSLIDVHHTILPLTGRVQPNAKALVESAIALPDGLFRLTDADMVLHSAAHWIQDGDLNGGLRNLHDIHRLISEFSATAGFWQALTDRASVHGLQRALFYALRSSHRLFSTDVPVDVWHALKSATPGVATLRLMDWLIDRRLSAISIWKKSYAFRLAAKLLYIRSHWLRMPPVMLAKHLGRKTWLRLTATP